MNMIDEFKAFINRGNVMDLAVGVVIGTAFGKIVASLVADIITPILGVIIGGIDFSGLSQKFGQAEIKYGNFVQSSIDFLIVAIAIFLAIKAFNMFQRAEVEKPTPPAPREPSPEEKLLSEIRDLLKAKP